MLWCPLFDEAGEESPPSRALTGGVGSPLHRQEDRAGNTAGHPSAQYGPDIPDHAPGG